MILNIAMTSKSFIVTYFNWPHHNRQNSYEIFITLMQAKNINNELIIELKYKMSILNDVTHKILFIY